MRGPRLVTTERVICLHSPGAVETVSRLESIVETYVPEFFAYEIGKSVPDNRMTEVDTLGVVVGGDGTFLRGVKEFAPREVPIVGINAGTLGFLTRVPSENMDAVFTEIFDGDATIAEHHQFHVTGGGLDHDGINEVTFEPAQNVDREVKRCRLEVFVEREYVGSYRGGGLLVNTPTGSTGTALSADGPVQYASGNETLQVTPLHTRNAAVRPLVVGKDKEIRVVATTPIRVSIDGARPSTTVPAGTSFSITDAGEPAYFVTSTHARSFMDALANKLGWPIRDEGAPDVDRRIETRSVDVLSNARQIAREAVVAAGEPVQRIFNQIEESESGIESDKLVDNALYQSERILTAIIHSKFPDHRITSEGWTVREGVGSYTWMIDPLDGTGNFVHGNPSFTIAVALLDGNEPVVGVVYSPVTGDLFHAIRGRGTYRNDNRIEPTDRENLDESMLLSGYDPTGEFLKQFYRKVRGVRRLGSASLHLCYVAAGSADAHWEFDTYPWDVAAGLCILREAGGRATDNEGNEYRIDLDDVGTRQPLLTSNGPLHPALLEAIPEHGFHKTDSFENRRTD